MKNLENILTLLLALQGSKIEDNILDMLLDCARNWFERSMGLTFKFNFSVDLKDPMELLPLKGRYIPEENKIVLPEIIEKDILYTLIHEIYHWGQYKIGEPFKSSRLKARWKKGTIAFPIAMKLQTLKSALEYWAYREIYTFERYIQENIKNKQLRDKFIILPKITRAQLRKEFQALQLMYELDYLSDQTIEKHTKHIILYLAYKGKISYTVG